MLSPLVYSSSGTWINANCRSQMLGLLRQMALKRVICSQDSMKKENSVPQGWRHPQGGKAQETPCVEETLKSRAWGIPG